MAFGKITRLVIAGLYVLAMLIVVVMPASSMAAKPAPQTVTATADCGVGMGDMEHAKIAGGACDLAGHQSGAPCMLGSICADLPSGMFASLLPAPIASDSEQPALVSATPLLGLDPNPGLRPPSLSV